MAKETLQQKAYELLRTRVLNCDYEPGAFLSILELEADFGFSRTPIREAVGRLEQEGLVKVLPKKGIVVCGLNLDIISTIYETRLLIEPYIVATYGELVDARELRRMRGLFEAKPARRGPGKERFYSYDDALHGLIRAACPNIYLVQALERISAQNHRVRILSGSVGPRLEQSSREHIGLIDAILAAEFDEAGRLMVEHLKSSRETAFRLPELPK